jgi:hypothetical protein
MLDLFLLASSKKLLLLKNVFFFSSLPELIWSLVLKDVEVPRYPVVGGRTILVCNYDLEMTGNTKEKLYSVKWYKDGYEFYRYM